MDPSPFIEKDLDDDAEEFIVSWAQEFPQNAPIKLRIHLDQWPADDPKELIRTAVHNHFAHRAKITDLEFNRLLKQGRTSLFIGLLFLAACLLLSRFLLAWSGSVGCRRAGEPYDWRMGRDVATHADLSVRLVAAAATASDFYQAEPHARGTRPKGQKLSGLVVR